MLTVAAPPSKAHTLRAMFLAALADGESRVRHPLVADDQRVAAESLRALGVGVAFGDDEVRVAGRGGRLARPASGEIDVALSGVSAYFLLPMLGLLPAGERVVVRGSERMETGRPIGRFGDALRELGLSVEFLGRPEHLPVRVGGPYRGGRCRLVGTESSKGFSGIIATGALAETDVAIEPIGSLNAAPYIGITLDVMAAFGVSDAWADVASRRFGVRAGQRYRATEYEVEGDFSNASYFFAAAAIGGLAVRVTNLARASRQGDARFLDVLERMGARVRWDDDGRSVVVGPDRARGEPALHGIEVDMSQMPDLVPTLAVTAAHARGTTTITGLNAGLLRHKESDRQRNPVHELRRLGVTADDLDDRVVIVGSGGAPLHPARIETYGDHRMAMSFALCALRTPGTTVADPEVCAKSFPDFWERFAPIADARRLTAP